MAIDPVSFTRELIDIESISGNERRAGEFAESALRALGYKTERFECAPDRFDVYAVPQGVETPDVVFSTHMDTVPPFMKSSEDAENIYGRGACDAKGIMAAQISAVERLRHTHVKAGLLFVVGEERDSLGARVANAHAPGARFLINGEPTGNRIAIASKGALRAELVAEGRMAHSAYPELGESAIVKLVQALDKLIKLKLPSDPEVGDCTMNIGLISGGRAPNVIPDHATAELLYRLIGESSELKSRVHEAVQGLARADFTVELPFIRLRTVPGIETMTASFTTDIPALSKWGEPILLGPGSIHVAHTTAEFISKRELLDCVELYVRVATQLLS